MATATQQRNLLESVWTVLTMRLPLPRDRLGFVGRFGAKVFFVALVVAIGGVWKPTVPLYDFWLRPLESRIRTVRDVRTGRRRAYEILAPTEAEIAQWIDRIQN